ncbi:MAG: DUF523 domain-containing protein [Candidatus Bathyarchaeota archaeon]|nr:DUF523 domain-containing protein [Candidatus Bathyarchaeota archaeon]
MKIVSACLIGINCRFDGKNKLDRHLLEVFENGELLPVCPEQLGGLPTPRVAAKIVDGDGYDVIDGKTKVINEKNEDVTENFVRGATEVLRIVKLLNIEEAILESKSPSCGSGKACDEASGNFIRGDGVLTALLKRNGIYVIPCEVGNGKRARGR